MLETTQTAKPAARRRAHRIAVAVGAALTVCTAGSFLAMQFAGAGAAVGSSPSAAGAGSPSGATMPGNQPGWKVTFADDFTGAALNEGRWGRYSGVPGSGEGALWRPDHALVGNGSLVLRGDKVGQQWVTGGVSQAKSGAQKYGRFDVRFRMPRASGIGYAILLYPAGGGWPPEIDMAEDAGGLRTRTMTTSHWAPGNQQQQATVNADFSQWHTVSVEWTASKLTYLLDGKPYASMTGAAVPQVPMWLGLQTQWWKCVSTWGNCPAGSTPAKVDLQVDWVVRYAADPSTVVKPLVTSKLGVSTSADRAGARPLDGARLAGKVYISAVPSSTPREVRFYLDNPNLVGAPTLVETYRPYDLAGGTAALAKPLNLATLAAGPHSVTAVTVGLDGRTSRTSVTFSRS